MEGRTKGNGCCFSPRLEGRAAKEVTGCEYATSATDTDYDIVGLGQFHRDRADAAWRCVCDHLKRVLAGGGAVENRAVGF